MGKIKKILESELVGGTQGTDVYPVTSTKAVYDENNVRLDTILKPATKEAAGLMSPEDKNNIESLQEEVAKKFDKTNVAQETGDATEKVMSQKVVTDVINDKLSKSEGGEVNKPITITNESSNYSTTINPDGSIYIKHKTEGNLFSLNADDGKVYFNMDAYRPLSISFIESLSSFSHGSIYNNDTNSFYAGKFVKDGGTNQQVLLGDGSTTSNLIKQITTDRSDTHYILHVGDIGDNVETFGFAGATKELAGLMTAADKKALDNIPNIYLPLSGGSLTGTLYLNNLSSSDQNGLSIRNVREIISVDQDKITLPEIWLTNGDSIPIGKPNGIAILNEEGKISEDKIPSLVGYISSQNGNIYSEYTIDDGNTILNISGNYDIEGSGGKIKLRRMEDGKGKLSVIIDGADGSVNAERFNSTIDPNKDEVWCTDGSRLNILNLLSNAAIYVAGELGIAESGIDETTVIDNPDSIIFSQGTYGGRFFARKGIVCYTHWKADISKNIAPPSRYGIETDTGVFPFNNQMYKFSTSDNIYIATCSGGNCTMKKLTL